MPKTIEPSNFECTCEQIIAIEIFAGTATLSDALRAQKFSIIAVDKTKERKPKVSLKCLDLTKDQDVKILSDILLRSNLGYLHLAPPCGTSSKAREKPLPEGMSHIRALPLRSDDEPLGLASLNASDLIRVQAANRLYEVTLLCVHSRLSRSYSQC